MERVRWTDERIDERMAAMDEKFDRLFEETHALRGEMKAGFADLRGEIAAVRTDLQAEIGAVRTGLGGEVAGVRTELGAVRTDLGGEIAGVRTELGALRTELTGQLFTFHRQVMLIVGGLAVALIGLLGAAVAQL
jgi:hypothetical protein